MTSFVLISVLDITKFIQYALSGTDNTRGVTIVIKYILYKEKTNSRWVRTDYAVFKFEDVVFN